MRIRSATALLATLFAASEHDFVQRVCSPVHGLPRRLKFFPTLAEVSEALDAEFARRIRIAANAKFVIDDFERRRKEAEQKANFAAQRGTEEQRAAQVQALIRPNRMPGAERETPSQPQSKPEEA